MNQSKPVRVFAVVSGKGGVGKTNVSVNLGVALSEFGHSVALLDADMGLANVDVMLGLHPRFNFSHVLNGEKSINDIMLEGPAGLRVVPGASGIQKLSELSALEQASVVRSFSELDADLDVLIVDTAAGISSSVITFARACQEVIVVVCDEPTSLTDAYAFIKLLARDYGVFRFQILTNMVQTAEQGQNLFSKLCKVTDRYLDVTLNFVGAIPEDDYLRKAVQKQSPVLQAFPQCRSSQAIRNIARKTESWPVPEHAGGHLEFFVERMVQQNYPIGEVLA